MAFMREFGGGQFPSLTRRRAVESWTVDVILAFPNENPSFLNYEDALMTRCAIRSRDACVVREEEEGVGKV